MSCFIVHLRFRKGVERDTEKRESSDTNQTSSNVAPDSRT